MYIHTLYIYICIYTLYEYVYTHMHRVLQLALEGFKFYGSRLKLSGVIICGFLQLFECMHQRWISVCVCIYIYMCVYMYMYTYIYKDIYIYTYMYIYVHIYINNSVGYLCIRDTTQFICII